MIASQIPRRQLAVDLAPMPIITVFRLIGANVPKPLGRNGSLTGLCAWTAAFRDFLRARKSFGHGHRPFDGVSAIQPVVLQTLGGLGILRQQQT